MGKALLSFVHSRADPYITSSQWYLTFRATQHLDHKHTVFGKLVGGEDVEDAEPGT